jgi:hypothetical protein
LGRAVTGVIILLFLAILGIVINVANAESQEITGSDSGCSTGNATLCQEEYEDDAGFFAVLRGIGVPVLPEGTPAEVNLLWIVILGTLLALAIYLLVTSAIPLTSE